IIRSISPSIISFIASAKTSHDARTALANTYAKPSRDHIMHPKGLLTNISKGTQSITEYMQHAKSIVYELVMLNALENFEDLTVKILNGLGDEFKDILSVVCAHDTPISFEELHEKLFNFEVVLNKRLRRIKDLPSHPTMQQNLTLVVINLIITEIPTTPTELPRQTPPTNRLTIPPLL
ncbi:hypothetical protein Ddye_015498, partial [Dipteronia dyeriana]